MTGQRIKKILKRTKNKIYLMYFMAGINPVIKPHTVFLAQRAIVEAIDRAATPRHDTIGFAIYNLLSTLSATDTGLLSKAENLRMAVSAAVFAIIEWECQRREKEDISNAELLKEALQTENDEGNTQEVELVNRFSKLYTKHYIQAYGDETILPPAKSIQLYKTLIKHVPLELDRLLTKYIDFINDHE